MKFAPVLLGHVPDDTTKLFIDYYTAQYRPKKDAVIISNNVNASAPTASRGIATTAVQNLAALIPLPYMNISGTGDAENDAIIAAKQAQIVETNLDDPPASYTVPKPRTAFPSFVDHPERFITFLEACGNSKDVHDEDKVDLYTTLFEMYLHKANMLDGAERSSWESKAKSLIDNRKVSWVFWPTELIVPPLTNISPGFN